VYSEEMPGTTDVLALILGGGQGSRLFPLTHRRSKPAVPIGGQFRLIDIPVSNCLHADIRRIFVLTQFNSASLNRHIAQTYRLDSFSRGFVEILAAEQTPDNPYWFQGTADAVRQASRHLEQHHAEYYLILAGDHLYRMDYCALIDAHIARHSDITIAAQPVTSAAASEMGVMLFDDQGHISAFEEKPSDARLAELGERPPPASFGPRNAEKPWLASMGMLRVLAQGPARDPVPERGHRLWAGDHPVGARPLSGARLSVPRVLGRRWHDSVVLRCEHTTHPG
jgi:glucose-1-phosphate adenylyltransferase